MFAPPASTNKEYTLASPDVKKLPPDTLPVVVIVLDPNAASNETTLALL